MSFWQNKTLTPKQKNEELIRACVRVFSTEDGRIVLNMLLNDLYFFEPSIKNSEALTNYAKFFIRERLGVRDTVGISNVIAETAASRGGK
jgi:hypothetical protein